MITGAPPFTGDNHFQLLYKHGNEAPDPPSRRSTKARIPPHVESAVLRALEKKPADRFDRMSDFCAALEGPATPRRARAWGLALFGAALVAGVAGLALWSWPTAPSEAPSRTEIPTPLPVTRKSEPPAESSQTAPAVERVKIALDSSPPGAWVAVNGEKRGRTPLAVELERGSVATVRFSLQGYWNEERRLVGGEDETLLVRLKKKKPHPKPPPIKTEF
jgi:serine/threonine-protein kinase